MTGIEEYWRQNTSGEYGFFFFDSKPSYLPKLGGTKSIVLHRRFGKNTLEYHLLVSGLRNILSLLLQNLKVIYLKVYSNWPNHFGLAN